MVVVKRVEPIEWVAAPMVGGDPCYVCSQPFEAGEAGYRHVKGTLVCPPCRRIVRARFGRRSVAVGASDA